MTVNAEEKPECKEWSSGSYYSQHPSLRKLTPLEKKFLLAVEHGDAATVQRMLTMVEKDNTLPLDVNCKDPVGRSATLMAIDNENLEMLEILLENGVESRDALLHAINAEYVEAVELLLDHEEIVHKEGEPHSWEKVERDISSFTSEITPLILAAHKDNYEILKILLDRGATLPMPHDVRCRCRECVQAMEEDCLCHSRSRINAYRALSSPSLICLSSIDPILTAFELSWELRRLSLAENEFKEDYQKLRFRCQDFATALLAQTRGSRELGILLNHDPTRLPSQEVDVMPLTRVEMAIKYKQKKFIAHPNIQQLLSTLWYDGLPGFRRLNSIQQLWEIIKIGVLFPIYSCWYMIFPTSEKGLLIRKPFFKFILHSFSYLFFLFLLILASQRVETVLVQIFGTEKMKIELMESLKMQRGQPPTIIETSILLFIIAHVWQETRELWRKGLVEYFKNLWNLIDFIRNCLHVGTALMRVLAYIQAQTEIRTNPMAVYIPREAWDAFDPMLIADGFFAAGNVFAALKLVHIFSINPYLGPLQISLGRMVIDIIKFFSIYTLVLFAFACGLNQLLWYYADREKKQCFSGPGGTENWIQQRDSCLAWRRFSNLFESSQTLFWASFGLVDISNFELSGIKSYTRFWGLLMFGSYSVINVVVLLNLLIAMMSNSYQLISERADEEWKFARTRLFMSYVEEGSTLPPPFNLFPTVKNIIRLFSKNHHASKNMSIRKKETKMKERDTVYQSVMCNLVWRYVTAQQKACESEPVTEDDIKELRQDVSSFRHDLMHVLRCNGMNTKDINMEKIDVPPGKKIQLRERRLIKDFSIGLMEVCTDDAAPEIKGSKSVLARLVGHHDTGSSQRWINLIQLAKKSKIIGSKQSSLSTNDEDVISLKNSIADSEHHITDMINLNSSPLHDINSTILPKENLNNLHQCPPVVQSACKPSVNEDQNFQNQTGSPPVTQPRNKIFENDEKNIKNQTQGSLLDQSVCKTFENKDQLHPQTPIHAKEKFQNMSIKAAETLSSKQFIPSSENTIKNTENVSQSTKPTSNIDSPLIPIANSNINSTSGINNKEIIAVPSKKNKTMAPKPPFEQQKPLASATKIDMKQCLERDEKDTSSSILKSCKKTIINIQDEKLKVGDSETLIDLSGKQTQSVTINVDAAPKLGNTSIFVDREKCHSKLNSNEKNTVVTVSGIISNNELQKAGQSQTTVNVPIQIVEKTEEKDTTKEKQIKKSPQKICPLERNHQQGWI